MIKRIVFGLVVAIAIASLQVGQAQAAEPTLSITPSIYQLDLSKPDNRPTYQLKIRNLSDTAVSLSASSLDVTGQTSTGDTVFAAPGVDTDHDIGSSLSYEPAEFELAAGSSQTVTVTINRPELLEPGGHYGAAVFTAGQTADSGSVGVQQAISSLLFLTTQQGGVKRIGQPTFTLPRFTWKLPSSTDVIIPNTGNIQIAPSGSIQFTRHGRLVADGAVNPDSNLILAGQSRLFKIPIRLFGGIQLAGRYQADLRLRASADSPEQRFVSEIVYVSPWFIVLIAGLIAIVVILARFLRRLVLHKRIKN